MSVLVLTLQGPLQSWCVDPRLDASGATLQTQEVPGLAAVTGMIASAMGLPRTHTEAWTENALMGVRVDRPGTRIREFQTVGVIDEKRYEKALSMGHILPTWRDTDDLARKNGNPMMTVVPRTLLSDARFTVALTGGGLPVEEAAEALRDPAHQLYLGLRACPPTTHVLAGVLEGEDVYEALQHHYGDDHLPDKDLRMVIDSRAHGLPDTGAIRHVTDIRIARPGLRRYRSRAVRDFLWTNSAPADPNLIHAGEDYLNPLDFAASLKDAA